MSKFSIRLINGLGSGEIFNLYKFDMNTNVTRPAILPNSVQRFYAKAVNGLKHVSQIVKDIQQ